jgi:hypothetical protein
MIVLWRVAMYNPSRPLGRPAISEFGREGSSPPCFEFVDISKSRQIPVFPRALDGDLILMELHLLASCQIVFRNAQRFSQARLRHDGHVPSHSKNIVVHLDLLLRRSLGRPNPRHTEENNPPDTELKGSDRKKVAR